MLDVLAAVLRAHKPVRDLLEQRLVAAFGFTAQSYSGAHRVAARGARILGGGAGGCPLRQLGSSSLVVVAKTSSVCGEHSVSVKEYQSIQSFSYSIRTRA